jgi:hypothetical protein
MKANEVLSTRSKRRSELDLMGMLVVLGLIFFHTGQIFYGGNFYVTNEPSSIIALVFVAFASMWGMPLMFLVSGITIWHSLRKRTAKDFVTERFKRLFIPFIVGLILIVPPQVYYGLKADPSYHESYLQFFPRFFNVQFAINFPLFLKGIPPDNLFQLSTMYFLIDLFIFTLLLLPVFLHLQKPSGKQWVERWMAFFHRPGAIYIFALPIAVTEAILGSGFSGTWNPFAWLSLIFYGFLFTYDNRFEKSLQKQWKLALILGIIAFIIWFAGLGMLYTVYQIDPFIDYSPVSVLLRFLRGFTCWFWVVAIMGLVSRRRRSEPQMTKKAKADDKIPLQVSAGAQKTTFKDRIAAYAKEAQLPFYILHQLPIVMVGFYVVQWEVGPLIKYIVISLSSLLVTWVLYDIGVRRTRLTRFLFGMRFK